MVADAVQHGYTSATIFCCTKQAVLHDICNRSYAVIQVVSVLLHGWQYSCEYLCVNAFHAKHPLDLHR